MKMKSIYDMVLFDLDGTLTDSEPGITGAVKEALTRMNFPIPKHDTLLKFIGPPMWHSFMTFCGMTAQQSEQAVEFYRETYNVKGAFLNFPYPGIPEFLDVLKSTGVPLAVATSKPDNIAYPVLDYFKLSQYFTHISAPGDNERSSNKKELILSGLNACSISPERAVMIGDTHFDAIGAREAGTNFIGVLYGFGSRAEMEQEGAVRFAGTISELTKMLIK